MPQHHTTLTGAVPLQVGALPTLLPQSPAEGTSEAVQVVPQEDGGLGAPQAPHVEEVLANQALQRKQSLLVQNSLATVATLPYHFGYCSAFPATRRDALQLLASRHLQLQRARGEGRQIHKHKELRAWAMERGCCCCMVNSAPQQSDL